MKRNIFWIAWVLLVCAGVFLWWLESGTIRENSAPWDENDELWTRSVATERQGNVSDQDQAASDRSDESWQAYFKRTASTPLEIAGVPVVASVADDQAKRAQGLSGVREMADNEVKLFIFNTDERHGFWMKDMLFSIDMIWVNKDLEIVHIEHSVSPETYPESFRPPVPARYVIETVAGFAQTHSLTVGDRIILPE